MIVLVKNALPIGGNKQVRPAVVVVVADSYTHAEIGAAHARFLCYVGESSVAIVFVEGVAHGLRRLPEIAGTTVDEKDVHPAVVVEIEEGATRPKRLGQISAGRHGVLVHPGNPAR